MANNLVQIKAVSEDGTLRPDAAEPGVRYLIVKAPRLPDRTATSLEAPRALLDDVVAYVREHRELSRKQYREFAERYGDPRNKLKRYADKLGPEEWDRRVGEFNAYVQTRFEDVAREMETRYEKLEGEFDTAVERIFGRNADAPAPETAPAAETPAEEPEQATEEAEGEADDAEADADAEKAEKASA